MNNDDWDAVSSDTPPDSKTDAWDAVSAPQPSRKRRIIPDNIVLDDSIAPEEDLQEEEQPDIVSSSALHQENFNTPSTRQAFVSSSFLKKAAIVGGVVLLLLVSSFGVFQGISIHNANVAATVTAQTESTAFVTHVYGTATAQAVATVTTEEQIYNQATSGIPAIEDPLSDDSNNWGVLSTKWGGSCAFTGGAYHLALSQPNYWIWCICKGTSNLHNFALQVQVNILKGNDGGIVFSPASNIFDKAYIRSDGAYFFIQQNNNQFQMLQSGSSSAITAGLNQPNTLTIIVNNSNFYFYVNSQFVTSYSFGNYSQSSAGLSAQSIDQATDVIFSNAKVWAL